MANMRHRFQAIGIDPDGNLALVTRKEHLLTFRVRHNLAAPSSKSTLRARRAFEPFEDFDRRYKLWSASWPDGSRAMLDSRGLLHLTSSDESIPAVTLVLADGELSGWTSNGQLFGKRYFTDNRAHEAMASGKSASLHASVRFFVEHLDA
jgi:hypothetical protein